MAVRVGRWALVVAAAVAIAGAGAQMSALRAAGLNGTPGRRGRVQDVGVDADQQLGVADRYRRGSGAGADRWADDRRLGGAPDHLFRVIGGIMLILIVIPAVLA